MTSVDPSVAPARGVTSMAVAPAGSTTSTVVAMTSDPSCVSPEHHDGAGTLRGVGEPLGAARAVGVELTEQVLLPVDEGDGRRWSLRSVPARRPER